MLKQFQTIRIIFLLVLCGISYAKSPLNVKKNSLAPEKSFQLSEILGTGKSLTTPAAQLNFGVSDSGTIHFLKAYFYPGYNSMTGVCTGATLGAVSVNDNILGFPFTNSQSVNFNGLAAYTLTQNTGQAIIASNIQCMELYMNGGNASNDSIACTTFPLDCSTTPSTCTSGVSKPATWSPNQQSCGPPNPNISESLYYSNGNGNSVYQCKFGVTPGTFSSCALTGTSTTYSGAFGMSINNGYAYIASVHNGRIRTCYVNAISGNFTNCVAGQSLNSPYTIGISGGYYYASHGTVALVNEIAQGIVNQTSGVLTFQNVLAQVTTNAINNVAINNGYIYLVGKDNFGSNGVVYYCKIDATNGTFSTACNPTANPGAINPGWLIIYDGYAYIANGSTTIYGCPVDNSGDLGVCATSLVTTSTATSITGITAYNNQLYFSDGNSRLYSCTISAGSISACHVGAIATSLGTATNNAGLVIY